jgi:hypothetical protein
MSVNSLYFLYLFVAKFATVYIHSVCRTKYTVELTLILLGLHLHFRDTHNEGSTYRLSLERPPSEHRLF